ncbi:hypothetical protein R1flu_019902 [Riccia fluitans]|uniref:ATP synthase subunit b', chloroplastic n=1 Tax=Riccia fluitans TaxID=41844 RepID=A0ABD1ZNG9_9MARC
MAHDGKMKNRTVPLLRDEREERNGTHPDDDRVDRGWIDFRERDAHHRGTDLGVDDLLYLTPNILRIAGRSLIVPARDGVRRRRVAAVAGLPCVERVARLTVEAKQGNASVSSLEESVSQAFNTLTKSSVARNAVIVATNVLLALPALAGEEKGKIFDFNLTLPIIVIEFLGLMVALDNIWFKPVAAVMDKRDEEIRNKLLGVRDNSGEIKKLQEEAEAIIKAARAETTAALNNTKKETAAALEVKLQESKARIEAELGEALANLEEQKEETLKGLDKQVQALSDEIIRKVIPFSI